MTNYFKYLPVSEKDIRWGLHVLNAGRSHIIPGNRYPTAGHPSDHELSWKNGRVLEEYQLIYILKGKGWFESARCGLTAVAPGTILILFPLEWHRFSPDPTTGWDEYWIGFKGDFADHLQKEGFITIKEPVIKVGVHERLISIFSDIIEITRNEMPGYQQQVSGLTLSLLGLVYTLSRQEDLRKNTGSIEIVQRAMATLRTNMNESLSLQRIALDLNVSYAWLRKAFKVYTGMAPHQYQMQLKIEQAKNMLTDPVLSIKQVALKLGFESEFYFSRIFKLKTGYAPSVYKKQINGPPIKHL